MDIVKYLNATVWATIGQSKINRVGVIAIRDIKKGTPITDYSIHTINNVGFLKLGEEDFVRLDQDVRDLILDRSMFREGQKNFYFFSPNMEVCMASFMNHSSTPNCDGRFALCDIKKGEEITEDYNTLLGDKKMHAMVARHNQHFM